MSFFKKTFIIFLMLGLLLFAGCVDPVLVNESSVSSGDVSSAVTESFVNSGDVSSAADESKFPTESSREGSSENSTEHSEDEKTMNQNYMKAVWLSQYDMSSLYVKDGSQRDIEGFKSLLTTVLNNIVNDGYNAVIVQVRPFADSFYPSEYYPISGYVSGSYGQENIYDPFAVIVDFARERGLSVHAWINPMRGMKVEEIEAIPDKYPIKQWYNDADKNGDFLVAVNGRYYLNPAHREVRSLIAAGAAEVCRNYKIDGVHIDDYFYPTTDISFDAVSYTAYKQNGGNLSLNKFRYDNINQMIQSIYCAIKEVDPTLLFGVSPMGNINTTYTSLYTDVYTWCSEEGYLDYICPQIYFGLEHQTFDFKTVFNTWKAIIKNDDIRLFVGMTLGKAKTGIDNYAGSGKYEWQNNKDIIKRCIEYLNTQDKCSGVIFFCYQYMYDPLTGISISETAKERTNMKDALAELGE